MSKITKYIGVFDGACTNCGVFDGCYGMLYRDKECLKKNTKIVCGFPGIGKSFLFKNNEIDCSDSDSSGFDKKEFPHNYIQHIKKLMGEKDYIFASTHKEFLEELKDCTSFYIVYPCKSLKDEYLDRYRKRGNPEGFINLIEKNWDNFIDDIENLQESIRWIRKIKLQKGQFLEDVIDQIN